MRQYYVFVVVPVSKMEKVAFAVSRNSKVGFCAVFEGEINPECL